jgi:hypothetical protein
VADIVGHSVGSQFCYAVILLLIPKPEVKARGWTGTSKTTVPSGNTYQCIAWRTFSDLCCGTLPVSSLHVSWHKGNSLPLFVPCHRIQGSAGEAKKEISLQLSEEPCGCRGGRAAGWTVHHFTESARNDLIHSSLSSPILTLTLLPTPNPSWGIKSSQGAPPR